MNTGTFLWNGGPLRSRWLPALLMAISGVSTFSGASESFDLQLGREQEWRVTEGEVAFRLFVPEDYTAERSWPLLYVFHGTGGRASTRLFQDYTGRRGFVIIGAPYAVTGEGSLSREGVQSEIRRIKDVRERLGRSLELDGRLFVGGFSKGGWMSELLVNEGVPGLRGALILGAGRIPDDVGRILDRQERQTVAGGLGQGGEGVTSIYVGIGQLDTNHVYSRRAEGHYRNLAGHAVIFEEYWAKAHRPGNADSLFLHQWLRLRAEPSASSKQRAWAASWWDAAIARSQEISSPIERLLYLETLTRAPLAALVPADKRKAVGRTLDRVRAHRSLQQEMEARRAYAGAQGSEKQFKRSDELVGVANQFHRVYRRFPSTFFGQRAALDVERIAKNAGTLRAGSREREALSFPKVGADERARCLKRFERFGLQLQETSRLGDNNAD